MNYYEKYQEHHEHEHQEHHEHHEHEHQGHHEHHAEKHIKVEVRYLGNPHPYLYVYKKEDTVNHVKISAMHHFGITAEPNEYCLQYGDVILNDVMTLIAAHFRTEHEVHLELIARGAQDTDGGK